MIFLGQILEKFLEVETFLFTEQFYHIIAQNDRLDEI